MKNIQQITTIAFLVLSILSCFGIEPDKDRGSSVPETSSQTPAIEQRVQIREDLLESVHRKWLRPEKSQAKALVEKDEDRPGVPLQKLDSWTLQQIHFDEIPLSAAVDILAQLLEAQFPNIPVNLVLIQKADAADPMIRLRLRGMTFFHVLEIVCETAGYHLKVEDNAIILREGLPGKFRHLETEFFAVSRSTFIRMTGKPATNEATEGSSPSSGFEQETAQIMNFLEKAGIPFHEVDGSNLAYDGSSMIVTHTPFHLEKIRKILARYDEVRQVEIEAKFLEVNQEDLNEVIFQWKLFTRSQGDSTGGLGNSSEKVQSSHRSLSEAFTSTVSGSDLLVNGEIVDQILPPYLPGDVNLASHEGSSVFLSGNLGSYQATALLKALSQKSGSDLLSAPRVTVLSGDKAVIRVAREFRYPDAYSDPITDVSSGDGSDGAGVAITAGTPRDFQVRNVGVELEVTPRVEDDQYSVTLDLHPKVTEFEGFAEYGGPSIAISGGQSTKVPSGYFQPIFSVREVETKVTVWDGATLVLGGLTREEIKTVSDKTPVLGDIPLLGRLFRSEGDSRMKKNLLIFVTAHLVTPGGAARARSANGPAELMRYQEKWWESPEKPVAVEPTE